MKHGIQPIRNGHVKWKLNLKGRHTSLDIPLFMSSVYAPRFGII